MQESPSSVTLSSVHTTIKSMQSGILHIVLLLFFIFHKVTSMSNDKLIKFDFFIEKTSGKMENND